MREFRFGIGDPSGLRSTVWKIWSSRAEAYIQSRMMSGNAKVSIHSSGNAQWSINSDWYGVNRPNQPNRHRHLVTWSWSPPAGNLASHVFRMSIPSSELRIITVDEDLSDVRWLPEPGLGKKLNVECYISPADAATAPVQRADFLAALELDSQRSLVLLTSIVDLAESDAAQLESAKRVATRTAEEAGQRIPSEWRGAALFVDETGVRGMVEFVPTKATMSVSPGPNITPPVA